MKEAERILKMHKNTNGVLKYKVKWQGFDETTWESEATVNKYKELLDDFNHYLITGERYDDKKLEQLRAQYNAQTNGQSNNQNASNAQEASNHQNASNNQNASQPPNHVNQTTNNAQTTSIKSNAQITSKPPSKPQSLHGIQRAVKVARAPTKMIAIEEQQQSTKKEKKSEKVDQKIAETNQIENQKQLIQQQSEMNKIISLQNHQNILNQNTSNQKGIQILAQKQQEVVKYIASQYPNQNDKIESIALELTQDQCVFQIQWRKRQDNTIPYPQFYSLEQFKLLFPLLYIQFIEGSILECQSSDSEVLFNGPGIDCYERVDLIRIRLEQEQKQ